MSLPRDLGENAIHWRRIHNLWISEIYQFLKPQVVGRLSLSIDQEVTILEREEPPFRIRPDIHLADPKSGSSRSTVAARSPETTRAVAFAEGHEDFSTESRHMIVVRDLSGNRAIAVLEVLSPTNKGLFSRLDFDLFQERRRRLLESDLSYLEIDGLTIGSRWLPKCLESLAGHSGVIWSSVPGLSGRHYRGWAWPAEGPLPKVPWDLGVHGAVEIDLDATLQEALEAGGIDS